MARKKYLEPILSAKEEANPILTFDIEASEWTNFLCLGFYDLTLDIYREFSSLPDAIDFMFKYCKRNKYKSIWAHFGGKYDFNFILDGLYNHGDEKYDIGTIIPRGSGMLSLSITDIKESYEIVFRDSSALLPSGLKSLGDALKVEVLKDSIDFLYLKDAWNNIDYSKKLFKEEYTDGAGKNHKRHIVYYRNKEVTKLNNGYDFKEVTYYCLENDETYRIYNRDDVSLYMKKDCISLAQCLEKFYSIDFIKKAGTAYTIAGQSLRVFQTYLDEIIYKSSEEEDEFVRMAYFGGRTEIFKHIFDNSYDVGKNPLNFNNETLGKLKEQRGQKLECYDANSLYPTAMYHGLYPVKFRGFTKRKNDYDPNGFGVWKVTVRVPEHLEIPPLGIQHTFEDDTSKYCFPVGVFEGYWTIYELEYAKTLGCEILEYHQGALYGEGKPLFKHFVEDMYGKRLKAQAEKDETTSFIVKLILNSTYGKIGMRSDDKETVKLLNTNKGGVFYKDIFTKIGRLRLEKHDTDPDRIFSKVIIPTYVTSYSRVHMHKEMMIVGADKVFYTDTDSIFTSARMSTGKELGKMKLEYGSNSAVFCLPKTYSIEDIIEPKKDKKTGKLITGKITAKGMTAKMTKCFTYDDLVDFQIGTLKTIQAYAPEKFDTIKTALGKGSFLSKSNSKDDAKIRYEQITKEIDKDILKEKEKGNILEVEMLLIQRKKALERYESVKVHNYREIRSRYDKRLPTDNAIDTKPIVLRGHKLYTQENLNYVDAF